MPASCTSSSAHRRRSTCAATTRSTPSGSRRSSRAGSGKWLTNFATLLGFGLTDEDLVQDGWTDLARRVQRRVLAIVDENPGIELTPELIQRAYEASDDEKMEDIRARCDAIVQDPATAEALKPWYRQLCKRPCFHDEYLQAYNRPSCHLVDTDGKGVERIDETGVWVKGVHYELDCLVFASGFEVGTSYERRSGFDTIGRYGEKLSEHWTDGMRSLHGMHVHGFPNLFILGFAQGANLDRERDAQLRGGRRDHRGGRARTRSSTVCARSRRPAKPRPRGWS